MNLRDFRIGWRMLRQEPGYSLVAVLGLAAGMATALLLLGFVYYSISYNAHVPHVGRTYIVKQRFNGEANARWWDQAPMLLRSAADRTAGVEAATAFFPTRPEMAPLTVRTGGQVRRLQMLTVLPGFADMLGLRSVQGDLQLALQQPEGLVLTEASALRLFGTVNAVGRTLATDRPQPRLLRVAAVVRNQPASTTLPFESLVGPNTVMMTDDVMRSELQTGQRGWWGKVLVRLRPGASPAAVTQALQRAVDDSPVLNEVPPEVRKGLGERKVFELALAPLRDAYFDQDVAGNFVSGPGARANPVVVAALGAVAVLALAVAALNYVNLAAVRVMRRQREMGIRKVLGAGVRHLVLQMLAESLLVALFATAIGVALAWLLLPYFGALMQRDLSGLLSTASVAAALALGTVLGLLTAAYPAWVAARSRPAEAVAGRPEAEPVLGMRLRRGLTVLQLATAMAFGAVTLAVGWQARFAMQASPGFDPAPLLVMNVPEPVRQSPVVRSFLSELAAQPGVAGASVSNDAVGRSNITWATQLQRPGGRGAAVDVTSVSVGFFRDYQIRALHGRLFDPHSDHDDDDVPLVLNAAAAKALGFSSPAAAVGQAVNLAGADGVVVHKRVIGIAPDIRFRSLRELPQPMAYELWSAGVTVTVRASDSVARAEEQVRRLWTKYFPDALLEMRGAGDIIADNYAQDARLSELLGVATAVALLIAGFGSYVLAANAVQRRAREIVLRKLHGARPLDIAALVAREAVALVWIAAALAIPLAALVIRRYRDGYVELAPYGYWPLLAALAATVLVSAAAVSRNAVVAMRMRPAQALR